MDFRISDDNLAFLKTPLALKALVSHDICIGKSTFEMVSKHMPKAPYPTSYFWCPYTVHIQQNQNEAIIFCLPTFATPFKSAFSAEFPVIFRETLCLLLSPKLKIRPLLLPYLTPPSIKLITQSYSVYLLNISYAFSLF